MGYRIKKCARGYVVEEQRQKGWLFKRTYWTHLISVSGIATLPWHFNSKEEAMNAILAEVRYNTILNSNC
jgi:hypothetical protein